MKITKQATDDVVLAELGGRLARIRLERNLTQGQLAEQAGVSKRTVERLESGAVATQLSGFIRVCRVLGVLERLDTLVPEPVPSPIAQPTPIASISQPMALSGRLVASTTPTIGNIRIASPNSAPSTTSLFDHEESEWRFRPRYP